MIIRRNSIIKRILCYIRRHHTYGDWDMLIDSDEHHLAIYQCPRCGYVDVIDFEKESLDRIAGITKV